MGYRSLEQMRVLLQRLVPGLEHDARNALSRVGWLGGLSPQLEFRGELLDPMLELRRVVEGGHDHVPALVPFRVIAVVPNDEPLNAVIVRAHFGH
jgi:hypothetical protein